MQIPAAERLTHAPAVLPELLEQVFAEQLAFGENGARVPLHSNVSRDEAGALYRMVRDLGPVHSAEVGLAQGISTLAVLQAVKDNGHGLHHVMDPFQHRFQNAGLAMVERAGLAEHMDFHQKFAEEIFPGLPRLQFVFIDSSHLFDLTLTEFVLADKKLEVGGVIGLHDLWMPSLQKLVRFVLNNRAYRMVETSPLASQPQSCALKDAVKLHLAGLLNLAPGGRRIFREELLHPWRALPSGNLLFLQKTEDDDRDWRFHRAF